MPYAHLNLNLPACDEVETTSLSTCACRRDIRAHPSDGRGSYFYAMRVGDFGARAFRDSERGASPRLGTAFSGNVCARGTKQ